MALLDAIAARLVSEGVADAADVLTTRQALVPTGSTPYLTLTAASGPGGLRTHNGGRLRDALVQVSVRALSAEAAMTTATAALAALDVAAVEVEDIRFLWIRPVTDLMELPPDSAGRALIAFKVQARFAA